MQKIIIIVNWEIWSGKEHKGKILEVNSLSSYIKILVGVSMSNSQN